MTGDTAWAAAVILSPLGTLTLLWAFASRPSGVSSSVPGGAGRRRISICVGVHAGGRGWPRERLAAISDPLDHEVAS